MTDQQLAEIRERAEKATPGPWECDYLRIPELVVESVPEAPMADESFPFDMNLIKIGPGEGGGGITSNWASSFCARYDDAEFTAHAREDIPALLTEVEAWREIGRVLAAEGIWLSEHFTLQQKARALLAGEF